MARILIVDDHALFAEAITSSLERAGHRVVGVVGTGRDALVALRRYGPDLVLLDLGLPDANGVDVAKAILSQRGRTRLLAVTASTDADSVRDALRVGFHGYVTKDAGLAHLIESVEAVLAGRPAAGPRATLGPRKPATPSGVPGERRRDGAGLTDRESEVLRLLVTGASTKAIASALHIAPNTVRSHIQSVLTKLQVHSRIEAVATATRHGLGAVDRATRGPRQGS